MHLLSSGVKPASTVYRASTASVNLEVSPHGREDKLQIIFDGCLTAFHCMAQAPRKQGHDIEWRCEFLLLANVTFAVILADTDMRKWICAGV